MSTQSTASPPGGASAGAASGAAGGGAGDVGGIRAAAAHGRAAPGADRHGAQARVRKRDRALRRAVLRDQGCMGRVPRAERRVLALRAGVGIARTRSRAEVARMTGLRRARVVRLERRGLRHLHALARAGACPRAKRTSGTAVALSPATAPPVAGGAPHGRGHVLAERHSGGERQSKSPSEGATGELSLSGPTARAGGSSFDLALLLVPLGLLAFAFVVAREVRRTS